MLCIYLIDILSIELHNVFIIVCLDSCTLWRTHYYDHVPWYCAIMICRLSILNNLSFTIPKTGLVEVQAYIRGCVKYCGMSQYLLWECNAMYDYCCMNIAYLRRYYSLLLWITGCTDNVYVHRIIDPGAGGPPGSRLNPELSPL